MDKSQEIVEEIIEETKEDAAFRFESEEERITSQQEIEALLKARYPLIWVITFEEKRVEKALRRFCEDKRRKVYRWTITEGWQGELDQDGNRDITDPRKALDWILRSDTQHGVFVLKDFHPYLKDPTLVRRLRDLCQKLPQTYKSCILMSPVLAVPPELEKELAVVDYDLPDVPELQAVLNRVLQPWAQDPRIDSNLTPHQQEKLAEAALGLTSHEAENVFAKSLVQKRRFDIDVIHSEKEQIVRKSGLLEFLRPEETIATVGGLNLLKDWLTKRSKAFTQEARDFGLPQPKGILLLGIPGCGKSLCAKAISSLWQLPLLRLDVGRVFGSLVGASEENIRRAIRTAEAIAPSILWLDELEKGLAGTQSSGMSDAGTAARVFGTFITWLQEKKTPVFVIATANNVQMLPPELLRKGRFDEIFFVDLPAATERTEIFDIHINKKKRDVGLFDIPALVEESDGYSGAEIEQAVISALYDAFDLGQDLTTEGLIDSLNETVPLSTTMQEEITKMRDWARNRARFASMDRHHKMQDKTRKLEI